MGRRGEEHYAVAVEVYSSSAVTKIIIKYEIIKCCFKMEKYAVYLY